MIVTVIFYTCCVALFWTVLGYGLFVKLLSCCKVLPVPEDSDDSFSIVLVVNNAEEHIKKKLDELSQIKTTRLKTIWVVDDGSVDATRSLTETHQDDRVKLLACERGGKSAALNQVREKIETDHAVLMDLRQSMTEEGVLALVNRLADASMGAVSGVLSLPGGDKSYWDMEKRLRHNEGLLGKTIGLSGSGCAISKKYWQKIPEGCLADDMALGLAVLAQGKKVCLDKNVKIIESRDSDMKVEMPRKIRTLSANWQIFMSPLAYHIPKNPVTLFFVLSHKFSRLLMPFMFIAALVTGLMMHCNILNSLFGVVGALMLLSLLPIKFLNPLKQLTYLNLAALVAFFVWPKYASKGYWESR